MPTRPVDLTDHHAALMDELVTSGHYADASEVVRHGLRLLERERQTYAAKLERLRGLIQEGEDALARGDFIEFNSSEEFGAFLEGLVEEAAAAA